MKPTLHSLSLLLLIFLTGCQSSKVWYQPGKTQAQIHQDWAESQLVAQVAPLGIQQPLVLSGDGFAAGLAIGAQRDARNSAKKLAPLTMQAKGYQLVPKDTVPVGEPYQQP